MSEEFLRASARSSPPLLLAVARFNAPGSDAFNASALPEPAASLLRSGLLRKLEGSPSSASRVREYLLRQSGIAPEDRFFTDFAEESRRLALVDRQSLERLMLCFGACVHAAEIAAVLRKEEVLPLRALLGEFYRHALVSGRYRQEKSRQFFLSRHKGLSLPQRLVLTGREALSLCVSGWPERLQRRAAPHLPETLAPVAPEGLDSSRESRKHVFDCLKHLLLEEVAPQWRPCFA